MSDHDEVTSLGAVEGQLARRFADRRAVLAEAGLDEPGLAALRHRVLARLRAREAGALRAAFQRAFEQGRHPAVPTTASVTPRDEPVDVTPAPVDEPRPEVPVVAPSYLLEASVPAVAPPSRAVEPNDETAFVPFARPGPTLPFVEGDAKAFIEASRVEAEYAARASPERDADAAVASSGDETQALDLRKVLEDVVPFQLEVERSLPAFVELLVALTSAPGREDAVGARFGVHTPTERERVLAGWRRRWDAEPALRAEWQRLFQLRVGGPPRD